MSEVERLTLWQALEGARGTGADEQRAMVRALVEYAAPILDRIIETFPTYTLHNAAHARNVAELEAKLLGDRVADLSALEGAFLILAAYWHDIGMVFDPGERGHLTDEPEWAGFLQSHPEAYLAVKGDLKAQPPVDVAEWYCRWRHAERVFGYIDKAAGSGLKFNWGVVDLREVLGNLCRSHNESVDQVQAAAALKTDFRAGQADLRFCAILLRLADILDFDRSRSPESVYEYLGLGQRSNARHTTSDVEWRKHLASEGFVFPNDRSSGYTLDFVAGPDNPAVEHDLRQFLEVIEGEFEQCAKLLSACSKRWRDFTLPARIRRDNVVPIGYRYGEYRFSFDQHRAINLLMGEDLYQNPHVFVREILQNALDASRLRQHLEHLRGNNGFAVKPIRVSDWLDRDRYRWVRFDDFGTGMDEQIVRDHLLKVGSSYYNSSRYKADLLRASKGVGSDFVPISCFGIGLLSCFLAGDRVEISSLRQLPDGSAADPVRLSLHGLHGFYTLQTPKLSPTPMPAHGTTDGEKLYRSEFGTSVAVRLDPRKEREQFDLSALLEKYLLCPPVKVELEGRFIGGDPALLETPWCGPATITNEEFEPPSDTAATIRICPLNITSHCRSKSVCGQGFIVYAASHSFPNLHITLEKDSVLLTSLSREDLKQKVLSSRIPFHRFLGDQVMELLNYNRGRRWMAYNGITIPTRTTEKIPDDVDSIERLGIDIMGESDATAEFIISMADDLAPKLSLSREYLIGLPWRVYSEVNLSLVETLNAELSESWDQGTTLFDPLFLDEALTLGTLLDDPLLSPGGPWFNTCLFKDGSKIIGTLDDVGRHLGGGDFIRITLCSLPDAIGSVKDVFLMCMAHLAYVNLDIHLLPQLPDRSGADREETVDSGWGTACFEVRGFRRDPVSEGEKMFPPLAFVPFAESNALRTKLAMLNRDHVFARWLIDVAPELSCRFPAIFRSIKGNLFDTRHEAWNRDRCLEGVNGSLARLAELAAHLVPAGGLSLKPEDLEE